MTADLWVGVARAVLPILGLSAGVTVWGLLMVRRAQDKAELGVGASASCHSCKSDTCSTRPS